MIGLTSFSGKPVVCVLIIKGKLPNGSIKSDVNINLDGKVIDEDFIIKNTIARKYSPSGPKCWHRSKKVPALVYWHNSVSITSDILVDIMHKTLDQHKPIHRDENVTKFLFTGKLLRNIPSISSY